MAVCMNSSGLESCTTEDGDVFECEIIESNDRKNILSSPIESTSTQPAKKSVLPPMSAPPIVNTTFPFDVDSSFVQNSANVAIESGSHVGDGTCIPAKKSRAKSLSFVQPACIFIRQCHERMTTPSCCLTENTLGTWKWRLQRFSFDRSNDVLHISTHPSEQPLTRYTAGAGVSNQVDNYVGAPLLPCGPQINAHSSPVIRQLYTTGREYSPGRICRICLDGAGALISPCLCTGTVALIHKDCLERWLTQTSSSFCELCMFNYRVERRPLPYHKVFSDSTNGKLRRSIITDLACFIGLTPLALAAISLCLLGAMQVFQNLSTDDSDRLDPEIAKGREASRQWEAGWLIFLAVMLLVVYIIWFSCTFNTHMKTWTQWRMASLQVKLLDVKHPCQNQMGTSNDVLLAPIRLMMDDQTSTPSDEGLSNLPVADSPMRVQLLRSPSPNGATLDGRAQDVGSTSGITAYGAGHLLSGSGEEARCDRYGVAIPNPFIS